MGLQQFERRLERLVEGVFAKAFRSSLRPVELGRRLTREMDLRRTIGVRGELLAPNVFRISLSPSDAESFASFSDALRRELADAAREHARGEGYAFLGPVEVDLGVDDSLGPGRFLMAAEVREAPAGGASLGSLVLADGERVGVPDEPLTLGRLADCDLVLNDPNVSRRHAVLRRENDAVLIVDLNSTNGTWVNGERVTSRLLHDGDEIKVGTTAIRFEAS